MGAIRMTGATGMLCAVALAGCGTAPPGPRTSITFMAGRRTETQQPSESLDASIVLDPREPGVRTPNHGWISARVGTAGRRVSLIVDAPALTPALGYLYSDGFRFSAHAFDGHGADEAPGAPASYPSHR